MATVLVVDDDADIVTFLKINLELDGHRVLTARDGEEALERVRSEPPDVMVLDIMMPGVDGWTVLERVKAETDLDVSTIPVLIVTALDARQHRIRGGIEGAIRYVTKPFELGELRDEVKRALEGEPEPVKRRRAQTKALEDLARLESGAAGAGHSARPHLTRLDRPREGPAPAPEPLVARERTSELSVKQRELLDAVATTPSVSEAAARLSVSRSNVYASLRRIGRKLGTRSVRELIALARAGELDGEPPAR